MSETSLPGPVYKLIKMWSRLPGVGEKTARRMVFFILKQDPLWVSEFVSTISQVREETHHCGECGCITDIEPARSAGHDEEPQDHVHVESDEDHIDRTGGDIQRHLPCSAVRYRPRRGYTGGEHRKSGRGSASQDRRDTSATAPDRGISRHL